MFRIVTLASAGGHMIGHFWTANLNPIRWVWMLAALALSVSALRLVLAGKRLRIVAWLRTEWSRPLSVALAVFGVSLVFGAQLGLVQVVNLNGYLGQPAVVDATVQSAHAIRGGWSAVIVIQRIAVSNGGGPAQGSYARATWINWGTSLKQTLVPGARVESRGWLALPPVLDAKGRPLRAMLQKSGIRYEWKGRVMASQPSAVSVFDGIRNRIDSAVHRIDPQRRSLQPLLESVVFGGAVADPVLTQQFLAAGLLHVLAASGANVVLLTTSITMVMGPFCRWLRCPRWAWFALMLTNMWVFTGLCSWTPSIVRACLMATYMTVGRYLGRKPGIWESTCLALVAMSWGQAANISSTSSLLSFVATLGVAVAVSAKPFRRIHSTRARRWHFRLCGHAMLALWITCVVELMILPVSVDVFHQVTPYAILSNFVVEPLFALLLPSAGAYLLSGLLAVWLHPASVLCDALGIWASLLLRGVLAWVRWVSGWPHAVVSVGGFPWIVVGAYYACFAMLAGHWPDRRTRYLWYTAVEKLATKCERS